MRKIEELVPSIIFAELEKERGVDLLKRKVQYHRKQTSADPLEQADLAEVLVERRKILSSEKARGRSNQYL
ncbi:MAG: hypothetical protein R6V83_14265 [Candidatus Thorarchaeota archaeon]